MPIPSLSGTYIDQTYQRLVQTQGGEFADGLGNPITFGTIDTGSFATTGSNLFRGNQVISGSLTVVTGSGIELQVTNTGVTIGNAATDIHAVTGSLRIQGLTAQSPFQIATGSASLLFVSRSGNVGIGNAAPTSRLHVGTATSFLKVTPQWLSNLGTWLDLSVDGPSGIGSGGPGANAWIGYAFASGNWFTDANAGDIAYRNLAGRLLFGNSGTTVAMSIDNSNVGIGTPLPGYQLDVNGKARINDTVYLTGLTGSTQSNVVSVDIATGQLYYQATGSGGGGGSSYNVFTALISQTGGSNSIDISAVSLTVGVTYQIIDNDKADFTNVGAPNNEIGTRFVAIGTTPTDWGNGILRYNEGAPTVKVLENTIGDIWFTYNSAGIYKIYSNDQFTENKTWITPIYLSNDLLYIQYDDTSRLTISSGGSDSVIQANTPIEIRVYN